MTESEQLKDFVKKYTEQWCAHQKNPIPVGNVWPTFKEEMLQAVRCSMTILESDAVIPDDFYTCLAFMSIASRIVEEHQEE